MKGGINFFLAVPRLIELCRSPTERNNSDSVLVACLVGGNNISELMAEHKPGGGSTVGSRTCCLDLAEGAA